VTSPSPEDVKSPVCGDPVPASGICVPPALLAPAGEAAIHTATTTLSAAATVSHESFVLIFSPSVSLRLQQRTPRCRHEDTTINQFAGSRAGNTT
jgi:hypothetical protein